MDDTSVMNSPSAKLSLIVFLEVHELDPKSGGQVLLMEQRYSLWLCPGDLQWAPEDEECGADMDAWVRKYAVRLHGTWDTMAQAQAAAELAGVALARRGTKVGFEFLCGD